MTLNWKHLLSLTAVASVALANHAAAADDDAGIIPGAAEGLAPAIATLLIFAILVFVLGKWAWGPIVTGLKAREDRIRKEISDAEEARAKAEATLREYNARLADAEGKVREMIAKAAADGERVATNLRIQAQKEAEDLKARAQRDIEATRDQALAEITERAADLATAIAAKILRRELNPEDQQDLVNASLDQIQAMRV